MVIINHQGLLVILLAIGYFIDKSAASCQQQIYLQEITGLKARRTTNVSLYSQIHHSKKDGDMSILPEWIGSIK